MKTTAAILWGLHQKWEVEQVELDGPKEKEVLVRLAASGLCLSDHHAVTGDMAVQLPVVGGHEGAGVVVDVGPGVATVDEGDHVVLSFIPSCGRCSACVRGMSNLCELGAFIGKGTPLDGTCRVHARGQDVRQVSLLGTFSEYAVVPEASVIKLDKDIPLDKAALLGCGVTTGYGSAVRTGETRAGDTVVVMGVGGIGINAVQGARIAGAAIVVALDPAEYKRNRAHEFGATHSVGSVKEARKLIADLTRGEMANVCVMATNSAEGAYVAQALSLVGKRGRVVITASGHKADTRVDMSLLNLVQFEKQVRGALLGSLNPRYDIVQLLGLYKSGQLKLDELITREYSLSGVNQGYEDMFSGLNLRGVIRF
jgi:NDMA-dependent alcohol dehydrogenase